MNDRMTADDTPESPAEEGWAFFKRVCQDQAAKGEPAPVVCSRCEDFALLWWPKMKRGTPDWYTLRCECLQAKNWGPVVYERSPRKNPKTGKLEDVTETVNEWRPYGEAIPLWNEFCDVAGRPLREDEVYSHSQRSVFDTHVAAIREEG